MRRFNEGALYNLLSIAGLPLFDPTNEKINHFLELKSGWHFGEGITPTETIAGKAKEFNLLGRRFGLRTDAFPGIDGSIAVTFYAGEHCLEVTINPDGSIDLSHEKGMGFEFDTVLYLENTGAGRILQELRKLVDITQCLSGSLKRITTIRPLEGSEAHVSPHQAAIARFQPSTSIAFHARTSPRFASTYESTIQLSP